jgi:hypothetical protein
MIGVDHCNFCGKTPDQVRQFIVGAGISPQGMRVGGNICSDCVASFMAVLARSDSGWFDAEVEKARSFEWPDDQPPTG